ncbi:MAG: hypothetical protein II857_04140 [Selenomonadaceae bacterium]|nr:hypothetical protein [Selenomonadaceae bacterium]
MDKEQLAKMIAEKIDAAYKASEHPKKFFITENGRGVVDGGDLYNAVLKDVLGVVTVAVTDIFQTLMAPAPAKPAEKPAEKAEKLAKVSTKK